MLATYDDLVAAIGKWLHRGDMATIAPDLITLAEARIYQGSLDPEFPSKPLRLTRMESVQSGDLTSNELPEPDGLIEIRKLEVGEGFDAHVLEYASRESVFNDQKWRTQPRAYSIESGNIVIGAVEPIQTPYRLVYFKRFDPLQTATTNWLITNAPNVYLYGALIEAAPYLNNDSRLATWYRLFSAGLNALQANDDALRSSGGALVMRRA